MFDAPTGIVTVLPSIIIVALSTLANANQVSGNTRNRSITDFPHWGAMFRAEYYFRTEYIVRRTCINRIRML
jgi:hypothetical protein